MSQYGNRGRMGDADHDSFQYRVVQPLVCLVLVVGIFIILPLCIYFGIVIFAVGHTIVSGESLALDAAIDDPTTTPITSRDITIEILSETGETGFFDLGEIFTGRDREGFQIWSHQSHFWRPGDEFNAGSLDIEIIFDDLAPYDPFVFWPNGTRTEVFDEDGNPNGFFMATPMNINASIANLALGGHTMTVRVTTPHDEIFEHSWQFVIQERDVPRVDIPPRLLPTAEYIRESPQPTPAFILRLPTEASYFDRFSGIDSREGICLVLDDTSFVPPDFHESGFRDPMWEDVIIFVDDIPIDRSQFGDLQPDTPGHWFICVDTDYLAVGVHLAEVTVTADGEGYTYMWAFTIE